MIPLDKLIFDIVREVAGEDVIPLAQLLYGKENISEFKLADKMELTVNQVRNMLYKLHSKNLVDFMRKKDKRKGWYIYYWTLDLKKLLTFLISHKQERLGLMEQRLGQKQIQDYFQCPNKCVVFKYDVAMESDFKCPECGSVLKILDTKKQISNIKKQIKVLGEELKDGKYYLVIEEERLMKKKLRAETRAKNAATKARKRKVKKKVSKRGRPKKVSKRGRPKKVKKRVKKKTKKKAKKKSKKKAKKRVKKRKPKKKKSILRRIRRLK